MEGLGYDRGRKPPCLLGIRRLIETWAASSRPCSRGPVAQASRSPLYRFDQCVEVRRRRSGQREQVFDKW